MIDSMLEHADSTASWADGHGCDDVPCPTYGESCPEEKASDLSNTAEELNLDNGPEWQAYAGNLSYWIVVSTEDDCEDAHEDIDGPLYVREVVADWSRDVQTFEALQSAGNGWTAEYDSERDDWWVTTPNGQGAYYRRVRQAGRVSL